METTEDIDAQLFRDRLPNLYEILGDKSDLYVRRVATLLRTYNIDVARLLALISAPVDLHDYEGWYISYREYMRRIADVYGVDSTGYRGEIRSTLMMINNTEQYTQIIDEFTELYSINNGAPSAPIDKCISVDKLGNLINQRAHTTASLRDVESIMSTMNSILSKITDHNTTTPYDALFTAKRLGATTGAISDVYIAEYMSSIPMIMKTNDDYNYQLHEYIVGLRMNELRSTIANFVYTYGYSSVLNPIFNDISTTPDNGAKFVALGLYNAVNLTDRQVYIEYLRNAVTLADARREDFKVDVYLQRMGEFPRIDRIEGNDVFEVLFLQLMSALFYAWKRLGFAHRDLNPGNIMLINLVEVIAIPIMVPAAIDEQTGEIIFVRRWITTDVLVVVIDYGYSSIEIPEFRKKYGSKVVSPISPYGLFEGTTTIENDFMSALRYLYRRFGARTADFVDIISMFYTGQSATQDMYDSAGSIIRAVLSLSGGSYIYPELPFYIERTLIKYCVKYSNKWTTPKYDPTMVKSILGDEDTNLIVDTRISDSRQAYLALIDEDTAYDIDYKSVIDNLWYRNTFIVPSIEDTDNSIAYTSWMLKFYKWTNSFPTQLNMQPLSYTESIDFLRRAFVTVMEREPDSITELNDFARNQAQLLWRY